MMNTNSGHDTDVTKGFQGAMRLSYFLIDNRPGTTRAAAVLAISQAEAFSSGQPRYSLTLTLLDA